MSDSATRKVSEQSQIDRALNWVDGCVSAILGHGKEAEITVSVCGDGRSLDQNAKLWAMLHDVAKQVIWYGRKLREEDWKDVFSAAWKQQDVVPGINGGYVVLGIRTSKMRKPEFAELIEIIYAFGSEQKVKWSEPALKVYEEYCEAQA